MNKPKTIIIPVILVWVTFVFNIIFAFNDSNKMIEHKECTYESDSQCMSRRMGEKFSDIVLIFFLIELIAVIFVNLSYCNNSFCCYLTGTIILFFFSILISFIYILAVGNEYTILIIAIILLQWIQMIVLIIYVLKFCFH